MTTLYVDPQSVNPLQVEKYGQRVICALPPSTPGILEMCFANQTYWLGSSRRWNTRVYWFYFDTSPKRLPTAIQGNMQFEGSRAMVDAIAADILKHLKSRENLERPESNNFD